MNTNYQKIKDYIASIEKYQIKTKEINQDNNEIDKLSINYIVLNEDINTINKDLIMILLKDSLCKELFFDKIEDVYIFNQNKFIEVIFNTNEYMDGSYTKYPNKIGMFVKDEDTIQLNFPYKDCVLVGGMDKEDDKVNLEVFYNEILEKDKINKLFEPKVFHNIKKYSYSKELAKDNKLDNPNNIQVDTNVNEIQFEIIIDENGKEKQILKDNLLIKGNNLLGLHSLAKRMNGMIDVIYIDPPYYFNDVKASDSFAYNSNFKLSTWLTFMKNRLEIARELLSDTGVIFISIDEDGQDYLKLLCDDIFNVNNYLGDIIWDKRNPKGNVKHLSILTENIISYSKNKSNPLTSNKLVNKKNGIEKLYKKRDEVYIKFKEGKKTLKEINTEYNKYISNLDIKEGLKAYKSIDEDGNIYRGVSIDSPSKSNNKYEVIHPITKKNCKIPSNGWRLKEEEFQKLIKKNLILFGINETTVPNKKQYLKDYETEIMTNLFSYAGSGMNDLEELELNKYLFANPKPLKLLRYLLEHSCKNSTILDFFAGSGTTAHSVLSLNKEDGGNRKFILLEQMDYIESITAERIRRCMIKENYEDNFLYMEMKESNIKELKNKIKSSKSKEELIPLINDNFNNGYFINIDNKEQILLKIEEIYLKATTKSNPLNDSIKLVIEKHMDNNLDYVSYEDIEELKEAKEIKDNEYQLNKSFYEGN